MYTCVHKYILQFLKYIYSKFYNKHVTSSKNCITAFYLTFSLHIFLNTIFNESDCLYYLLTHHKRIHNVRATMLLILLMFSCCCCCGYKNGSNSHERNASKKKGLLFSFKLIANLARNYGNSF